MLHYDPVQQKWVDDGTDGDNSAQGGITPTPALSPGQVPQPAAQNPLVQAQQLILQQQAQQAAAKQNSLADAIMGGQPQNGIPGAADRSTNNSSDDMKPQDNNYDDPSKFFDPQTQLGSYRGRQVQSMADPNFQARQQQLVDAQKNILGGENSRADDTLAKVMYQLNLANSLATTGGVMTGKLPSAQGYVDALNNNANTKNASDNKLFDLNQSNADKLNQYVRDAYNDTVNKDNTDYTRSWNQQNFDYTKSEDQKKDAIQQAQLKLQQAAGDRDAQQLALQQQTARRNRFDRIDGVLTADGRPVFYDKDSQNGIPRVVDSIGRPVSDLRSLKSANGASADSGLDTINQGIATADRLLNNSWGQFEGTGMSSLLGIGKIPGTSGADYLADLKSLGSDAFLSQVKQMKGMGALSDKDAAKLEASIANLDPSQSHAALTNKIQTIKQILTNAQQKAQASQSASSSANNPATALAQAKAAIAAGADRNAVIQRLQAMGVNPTGL